MCIVQRANSAPEPNLNLQTGYRDIQANLTKLEENVIALLEKNEHIITNDHLGSTYQQVCNTIDWINEQLINIEPRCLMVYVEPERVDMEIGSKKLHAKTISVQITDCTDTDGENEQHKKGRGELL